MRRASCGLSLRAVGVPGLLALALAFTSAGCKKTALYTYVSVHVMIDVNTVSVDRLAQVTRCVLQIGGAEPAQPRTLRCPPRNVNFDVGTFEWETHLQEGTLQFTVQIFDSNLVLLGQGTSESVPIAPGKHLTASVLVVGVQPVVPDGGTPTDASTEGGGDAAAANDTAQDGTVDGTMDGTVNGTADGTDTAIVDGATDGATTSDAATSDGATTDAATDTPTTDGAARDLGTGDGGAPDAPSGDGASDTIRDGNGDGLEAG